MASLDILMCIKSIDQILTLPKLLRLYQRRQEGTNHYYLIVYYLEYMCVTRMLRGPMIGKPGAKGSTCRFQ